LVTQLGRIFELQTDYIVRVQTNIQDFAFNQLAVNCVAAPDSVFSPYEPVEVTEPGVVTPDTFSVGALQDRYIQLAT
jgi:hypothetical protein